MPEVCKFFLRGACHYGNSCRFSHDTGSSNTGANAFGAARDSGNVFGGGGGSALGGTGGAQTKLE